MRLRHAAPEAVSVRQVVAEPVAEATVEASVVPVDRRAVAASNALHAGLSVLPLAAILALVAQALYLKAKLGIWPLPANHPGLEHVALVNHLALAVLLTVPLYLALSLAAHRILRRRLPRALVYGIGVALLFALLRLDPWGLTGWLE